MKDISEVRSGLERISNVLGATTAPRPPRFRGERITISHPQLPDLNEQQGTTPSQVPPDFLVGLDQAVSQTAGVEALAWYHPFHVSPDEWGIYIPVTSLHYVAHRWLSSRIRWPRRLALAFDVLLAHEVIHHVCEYAVAQYELLLQVPCWRPARERLRAAGLDWLNDEEALANANCIRRLARNESASVVNQLHRAFLQAPPGYRDFPSALEDEGFEDHLLEVLRHNVGIPALDLKAGLLEPAFDASAVYPHIDTALGACPIHLIDDAATVGLPPLAPRLITCLPHIDETAKFQRMLRKLDRRRQEEWAQRKAELATSLPRHPVFEKIRGRQGLFSIRLGAGFRAHLREAAGGRWEAVEVGSHAAMGHE